MYNIHIIYLLSYNKHYKNKSCNICRFQKKPCAYFSFEDSMLYSVFVLCTYRVVGTEGQRVRMREKDTEIGSAYSYLGVLSVCWPITSFGPSGLHIN